MPLLTTAAPFSNLTQSAAPLFSQYVFVRCDLAIHYFQIRYTPGVVSFVAAGPDPLPVPDVIIESIRARCIDGVLHLNPKPFRPGEQVRIVAGPFRGLDAIFERYLSGPERVAILLSAIEGSNLRLIASAASITR